MKDKKLKKEKKDESAKLPTPLEIKKQADKKPKGK